MIAQDPTVREVRDLVLPLPAGAARAGIVPPGASAAFLAKLSVDDLPVSTEMRRRLRLLGLRTLGDLARLPQGPVAAQFGAEGARAWELAHGIDRSPLVPYRPPRSITERLEFPEPVETSDVLVATTKRLLERALHRPELHGRAVRSICLRVGGDLRGGLPSGGPKVSVRHTNLGPERWGSPQNPSPSMGEGRERAVLRSGGSSSECIHQQPGRPLTPTLPRTPQKGGGGAGVPARPAAWERVVTFREPVSSPQRMLTVLKAKIESGVAAGQLGAFDEVELVLMDLCGESVFQGRLFGTERSRVEQEEERVAEAARQLKARYGRPMLAKVMEVEPWSRIPERRFALIDFDP